MHVRYRVELDEGERRQLEALVAGARGGATVRSGRRFFWPPRRGVRRDDCGDGAGRGRPPCTGRNVDWWRRAWGALWPRIASRRANGRRRRRKKCCPAPTACSTPPEGRATWTLALSQSDGGADDSCVDVAADDRPSAPGERPEALAAKDVVRAAHRCPVRRADGRRARVVYGGAAGGHGGRVCGRNAAAVGGGGAVPHGRAPWTARSAGLRVSTERHRECVRRRRCAPAVADDESHRAADRARLRRMDSRPRR